MKATPVLLSILCLAVSHLSGQHIDGQRLELFRAAEALTDARQDSAARVRYLESLTGPDGRELADSLAALAYHRIATGYYNAAEDTLAMPYFRRSLALRDSLFAGPHNERAHVRTNMGMSMYYYGDLDSATLLIQEAIAIYERLERPDTLYWIQGLNQLGYIALRYRNYSLGYASSYRAIELLKGLDEPDDELPFVTYYQAARVLLLFGDTKDALAAAEKALQIATEQEETWNAAAIHNLLALIERQLGNEEASIEYLRRTLALATSPEPQWRTLGVAAFYLAEHYAESGMRAERDRSIARGRSYFARSGLTTSYYNRVQLPQAVVADGDYAVAEAMVDSILAESPLDTSASVPTADIIHHINGRLVRAQVHRHLKRPELALQDYFVAFDLQDQLRRRATDALSRRYLSSELRPDIDAAVKLYYDLYLDTGDRENLWGAFRWSERARAFSLRAQLDSPIKDKELTELQRELAHLELEVARGNSGYKSKLEATRIRLDRLVNHAPVAEDTAQDLDKEELSAYLAETNTLLLEYFISDSLQLAFLLTPAGELSVYDLQDNPDLNRKIVDWTEAITNSSYRRKSLRSPGEQRELDRLFLQKGMELARYLLPVNLRQRLYPAARLCVIPDASLSYLPFAALPLGGHEGYPLDYRNLVYFGDSVTLSYAHSGAYLSQMALEEKRVYENDLLVFAPVFSGHADYGIERSGSHQTKVASVLRPLIFNREEANEIAGLIPGTQLYQGENASRKQFLSAVGRSRILHLSTHGSVDPTEPQLSFIAFSQVGDAMDETELLYFNDLTSLSIANELTVLSACETGLGKLASGETPLSFAAAFAASGAKSTLTTLWEVDDRATKELMVEFYRRLTVGEDRAAALQSAQEVLRSGDFFHPYYWSASTLYGDAAELDFGRLSSSGIGANWSYLALCCIGIAGLFLFYHLRTA